MNYWLVKTEPSTYAWADLVRDTQTDWNGVRNFGARNHLRAMKKGDLVFVYHSVDEKAIVGIAKVVGEAVPDTSATDGDWSMVKLAATESMKQPITLDKIKRTTSLKDMVLVKNSRLSVQPVTKDEWKTCLSL